MDRDELDKICLDALRACLCAPCKETMRCAVYPWCEKKPPPRALDHGPGAIVGANNPDTPEGCSRLARGSGKGVDS